MQKIMQGSGLLAAYLEHRVDLLKFLGRRLDSQCLAADVAHDLYLRLCRIETLPAIRDQRAYIFSMAANLATDYLRIERRRNEICAAADGVLWRQEDDLSPERHALARAELTFLEAEVAKLDPRCREVFYLSRYQGRSQAEIAAALGIGITTVYKDLKTALSVLTAAQRRFYGKSPDCDG